MSFAQEMKDFLTGWTAVNDITDKNKSREIDRQYKKAWEEISRSELGIKQEELKLKQEEAKRRAAVSAAASSAKAAEDTTAADSEAAVSGVGDFDVNSILEDAPGEVTSIQARGGLVQYAEEGAPVTALPAGPDTPRPKPRPADLTSAVPTEPPAPKPDTTTTTPSPAPEQTPEVSPEKAKATTFIVETAREAGADVMKRLSAEIKAPDSAVGPGSDKSGMNFVTTEGGMSPEEIKQMEAAVDPNGTMAPHLKTMATFAAAHKYFMDKGQPEKAFKAAAGYLIGNKALIQTTASLIPDAIENGNAEAACRLFNDACNRFPGGGYEVIATPDPKYGYSYVVKDPMGKLVEEGKMNANQMIEAAGSIANGQAFTDQMIKFVSDNRESRGSPNRAVQAVEQAASELAGIRAAMAGTPEKAVEDMTEAEIAALKKAEKDALARLNKAKQNAADLKAKPSDIRGAQTAGLALAIPYEFPAAETDAAAAPADTRNTWQKYAPELLGGKPDPTAAVPTETPAQTPVVTPEGNPALKPLPADALASAKAAIAKGADRAAVIKRIIDNGFSAEGL